MYVLAHTCLLCEHVCVFGWCVCVSVCTLYSFACVCTLHCNLQVFAKHFHFQGHSCHERFGHPWGERWRWAGKVFKLDSNDNICLKWNYFLLDLLYNSRVVSRIISYYLLHTTIFCLLLDLVYNLLHATEGWPRLNWVKMRGALQLTLRCWGRKHFDFYDVWTKLLYMSSSGINFFRDWVKKSPHLQNIRTDDAFLTLFLRCPNFYAHS